jgi:hypothetical protein
MYWNEALRFLDLYFENASVGYGGEPRRRSNTTRAVLAYIWNEITDVFDVGPARFSPRHRGMPDCETTQLP